LEEFEQIRTIGTGATGIVKLVQDKQTRHHYAMKIVDKQKVIEIRQLDKIMSEKAIMEATDFPFLVSLYHHFEVRHFVFAHVNALLIAELIHWTFEPLTDAR